VTERLTVLFVGVGGQGVLAAARLLGETAHRLGIEVAVSQLHDMAQRGGAVSSSVHLDARGVAALERGTVDILVGMEPLEALRAVPWLSPAAVVVCDRAVRPPPGARLAREHVPTLPEIAVAVSRRVASAHWIDATGAATSVGHKGSSNAVMLGALSQLARCPVPAAELRATLLSSGPERAAANAAAFALGEALLADHAR
jgi:indolepyruvate ferredoxin oxidoreductase beta subunit